MNKLLQHAITVLILAVTAAVPAVYIARTNPVQTPVEADEVVTVPGTTQCVVGELVLVKALGTNAAWTVEPPSTDAICYGVENEHFVGSFRAPGRYVVVEASQVDGKTTITKTVFVVAGGGAATGWTAKITEWGTPANAGAIAANFREVADYVDTQTKAGSLVQPQDILDRTAEANRKVGSGGPFFTALEGELSRLVSAGELSTQRDYVRVWREIANALDPK